jgi:hypothetical protein
MNDCKRSRLLPKLGDTARNRRGTSFSPSPQPDAPDQFSESRVAAQRIETRVAADIGNL